jgi:hypothetical protein
MAYQWPSGRRGAAAQRAAWPWDAAPRAAVRPGAPSLARAEGDDDDAAAAARGALVPAPFGVGSFRAPRGGGFKAGAQARAHRGARARRERNARARARIPLPARALSHPRLTRRAPAAARAADPLAPWRRSARVTPRQSTPRAAARAPLPHQRQRAVPSSASRPPARP